MAAASHPPCLQCNRLARDADLRLTFRRLRTLEILLDAHEALGAYEVLVRLDADGFGSKPPVAYRALTSLVDAGLAHRIELLNAFVACVHPGQDHDPAFLICKSCGTVAEGEAAVPQPSCLRCPVVSFNAFCWRARF